MAKYKKKKLKFQKGLKKLSPHQSAIAVIAIVGIVGLMTSLFGEPASKSYSDESVTGNFYLANSMIGHYTSSGEYTEILPSVGRWAAGAGIHFEPITIVSRNKLFGPLDVRIEWKRGGSTWSRGYGYCGKWCGVRVNFATSNYREISLNGKIGGPSYIDANYYSCTTGKTCASHFRINAGDGFSEDTILYVGAKATGSYYNSKRYLDNIKITFYPKGTLGRDVTVIG